MTEVEGYLIHPLMYTVTHEVMCPPLGESERIPFTYLNDSCVFLSRTTELFCCLLNSSNVWRRVCVEGKLSKGWMRLVVDLFALSPQFIFLLAL